MQEAISLKAVDKVSLNKMESERPSPSLHCTATLNVWSAVPAALASSRSLLDVQQLKLHASSPESNLHFNQIYHQVIPMHVNI